MRVLSMNVENRYKASVWVLVLVLLVLVQTTALASTLATISNISGIAYGECLAGFETDDDDIQNEKCLVKYNVPMNWDYNNG